MNRRSALMILCGGAIGAVLTAGPSRIIARARADELHWGYEGAAGPENWGNLSPDFRTCALGLRQSPIDLKSAIKARLGAVAVHYRQMPLRIINNGHTIQVNAAPGSQITLEGVTFDLVQFHWHTPSEHLINDKRLDMEMHFVHQSSAGNLAVLGVLMKRGRPSAALAPVWAALPRSESPEQSGQATIDPTALLPKHRGHYRYDGSLTTPPCTEGISWVVFEEPIEVSEDQIRKFAAIFPMNARPVQDSHHRRLLESL